MQTFTANEAKTRFGEFIDSAQREPVRVVRHDRVVGVMVSAQDYEAMRAGFQVGSGRFPHGVLPGSEQQSLEERAQWVVDNANALTVDLPAESA